MAIIFLLWMYSGSFLSMSPALKSFTLAWVRQFFAAHTTAMVVEGILQLPAIMLCCFPVVH